MATTQIFVSSVFFVVAALLSCFVAVCLSRNSDDQLALHRRSVSTKAIYQFGDSLSDTGNLIHLNPSYPCGKLPYGKSYNNKPTGRCSDGLLMIDYFAKFMDLPLIDVYLNKDGNFKQGVNFALGGATALNASVLKDKYGVSASAEICLSAQLGWFKSHLQSLYPNTSERRTALADALFLMGEIGGNDYNFAFFQGKPLSDVYKMVPDVVQAIRNGTEEIIDLGATRIVIPGNFPIGCVPAYLNLFKTNDLNMYDELKCLKDYNGHAIFHNDHLRNTIIELQKGHPNVSIVYMDYFGAFKDILRHSTSYGYDEATIQEACYGTDNNKFKDNTKDYSESNGVPVCDDPQKYISWDGIHLTQQAYHDIAKQLMQSINSAAQNSNIWVYLRFTTICLLYILVF